MADGVKKATIDTREPLPTVEIDGTEYPLKLNLDYVDLRRMAAVGKRISELTSREDALTEQEEAELSEKMRTVTAAALDLPPDVDARLKDLPHRMVIAKAYNEEVEKRLDPFVKNGGDSLPASKGSTVEVPETGKL